MGNSGPLHLKIPRHLGNSFYVFLVFLRVGLHSSSAYSQWFSVFPGCEFQSICLILEYRSIYFGLLVCLNYLHM